MVMCSCGLSNKLKSKKISKKKTMKEFSDIMGFKVFLKRKRDIKKYIGYCSCMALKLCSYMFSHHRGLALGWDNGKI